MNFKSKLRPTATNREEVIGVLTNQLLSSSNSFEKAYDSSYKSLLKDIDEAKAGGIGPRVGFLFTDGLNIATTKILSKDASGWMLIQSLSAMMNWGIIIDEHHRQDKEIGFDASTGFEYAQIFFHGLALSSGNDFAAELSARILANYMYSGGFSEGTGEANNDFAHFYWRLIIAQLHNEWVPKGKLTDDIGHFRPLLEFAGSPDLFEKALVEYCDFRMARSMLYDNPDAKKQRKASDGAYIFEVPFFSLFPIELFALKAIYEKTTGNHLSLEADHPLLKSQLMKLGRYEFNEDKTSTQLEKLGEKYFGAEWSPSALTPLAF